MLEALRLMMLGQGPMFTFSLTEKAQDERALLHTQKHTIYTHAHSQTNTLEAQVTKLLLQLNQ